MLHSLKTILMVCCCSKSWTYLVCILFSY